MRSTRTIGILGLAALLVGAEFGLAANTTPRTPRTTTQPTRPLTANEKSDKIKAEYLGYPLTNVVATAGQKAGERVNYFCPKLPLKEKLEAWAELNSLDPKKVNAYTPLTAGTKYGYAVCEQPSHHSRTNHPSSTANH